MTRRYFYDTEFLEDGRTIELVSLGIVDESGQREYYAVSTEFDAAGAGSWVRRNVLDKLPSPAAPVWKSRRVIRDEVTAFLTADGDPELWAWMGAYDHVVLCQLYGAMPDLPAALPRFTRELRQRWEDLGCPPLPAAPDEAHDALADARHNLARWRALEQVRHRRSGRRPATGS